MQRLPLDQATASTSARQRRTALSSAPQNPRPPTRHREEEGPGEQCDTLFETSSFAVVTRVGPALPPSSLRNDDKLPAVDAPLGVDLLDGELPALAIGLR